MNVDPVIVGALESIGHVAEEVEAGHISVSGELCERLRSFCEKVANAGGYAEYYAASDDDEKDWQINLINRICIEEEFKQDNAEAAK